MIHNKKIYGDIQLSDITTLRKEKISKVLEVNTLLKNGWYLLGVQDDCYLLGRVEPSKNELVINREVQDERLADAIDHLHFECNHSGSGGA